MLLCFSWSGDDISMCYCVSPGILTTYPCVAMFQLVMQLLFLLYLLATWPDVQEKLFHQVQAVAPPFPEPLRSEHINDMSYLKACFKESIR